jgi:hypothetical protein
MATRAATLHIIDANITGNLLEAAKAAQSRPRDDAGEIDAVTRFCDARR